MPSSEIPLTEFHFNDMIRLLKKVRYFDSIPDGLMYGGFRRKGEWPFWEYSLIEEKSENPNKKP